MENFNKNAKNKQKQFPFSFGKREWMFMATTLIVLGINFYFPANKIVNVLGIFMIYGTFLIVKNGHKNEKNHEKPRVSEEIILGKLHVPPNMPLPYVVVDEENSIVLYNKEFESLFPDMDLDDIMIQELFKEYQPEAKQQILKVNDFYFQVFSQKSQVMEHANGIKKSIYSLCFVDITENHLLRAELEEQKTAVAFLFLDNFEEVLDTLDESRLPILTALIDRKLNALAVQVGGVIKKFEKDRYIFLLSQGKLEELKEKKFEILNEIREISVGEHIPVTISIGVGLWQENLELTQKSAKAAIDLSLGRGGDQVLIKDGEKYLFYGGKTGEVGHNARIRARVKADALWELMGDSADVLVMGHKQGDFDSLGAAIGIYAIAKAMGKECHIVLNEVTPGIRSLYNKLREIEEYDSLFLSGQEASNFLSDRTLLVITDTHRYGMTEYPELIDQSNKVVIFDHHRKSTDFIDDAVLIYHEPYASSTAELVTEMIQYFGKKVKLKPIEADALLAGITVDTKNFCLKTGAITFEAAAFLKRSGGDGVRVKKLFQNDMESYKMRAMVVKNAELFENYYAISTCYEEKEEILLIAAQAADELLNVAGVLASFVTCQKGDTIFISARSFGEVNVQLIMEKLGGGGHLTISGAQLHHCSMEEAKEKLKEAIQQYEEEAN